MKKFVEKHYAAIIGLSSVMICAVIVLGVYVWCDVRADSVRDESLVDLYETEMYNAANSLYNALAEGNLTAAYHYSKSAEEYAGRADEHDEAILFAKISACLERGENPEAGLSDALGEYLIDGDVPDFDAVRTSVNAEDEIETDSTPASVSDYRLGVASETTAKLFGVGNVLHLSEKNAAGELIFTCRNAYAVIDEMTGMPIEAAVSLERGDHSITAEEGIADAVEFLSMFYPKSTVSSVGVKQVSPNGVSGTYDIMFTVNGENTLVSVKRDSGRVVRLVTR